MPNSTNPSLNVYNRLESRARQEDFRRSLRAEVRDALWLLCRQWQFGEFEGEDTGTALFTQVTSQSARLKKYALRSGAVGEIDGSMPLEAIVEKEKIPWDLTLRLEVGSYWQELLRVELGESSSTDGIIQQFLDHEDLQFHLPATGSPAFDYLHSDPDHLALLSAISNGRALDGGSLLEALQAGQAASGFLNAANEQVDQLGELLKEWFAHQYYQPENKQDASWHPAHLEYQFDLAAPKNRTDTTILRAEEYPGGHLDACAFDVIQADAASDLTITELEEGDLLTKKVSMIPVPARFPGMPLKRFWEMEDYAVRLGDLHAGKSHIAQIVLAEMALDYGNDWMLVPYNLPDGTLTELTKVIAEDNFGQRTLIGPADVVDDTTEAGEENILWTMYTLQVRKNAETTKQVANQLLLPFSVFDLFEGSPVEEVHFFRDEMFNGVWGIETIIPNGTGTGGDGRLAAQRFQQYLKKHYPQEIRTETPNEANIKYQLIEDIPPENWIPFIAVKRDTDIFGREIFLQRAALPRLYTESMERIRPRSPLLSMGQKSSSEDWITNDPSEEKWHPLYLHEEEIPRAGIIVSTAWHYTRNQSGTPILWLGKRKHTGKGETASGMDFDRLIPKQAASPGSTGSGSPEIRSVTLQPGKANGKNTYVIKLTPETENTNYNGRIELRAMAWTNRGRPFIYRSLLEFNLDEIPKNAKIKQAQLTLFGITIGNLTNSTQGGSNDAVLQRIVSPWDVNTVTWNTQPDVTSTNQVVLPKSTGPNQNYILELTNLIQDMVDNPQAGFGFMLKLGTEKYYRSLVFASCNHESSDLHPKLEIEYEG